MQPLGRGRRKKTKNSTIWNKDTVVTDIHQDPQAFMSQSSPTGFMDDAFIHSLNWNKPVLSPDCSGTWMAFSSYIARHMDEKHETW